jgi:hypothetical protein
LGTNGDDAQRARTSLFNGTLLTAFSTLSYSTFIPNPGPQASYIQLFVDNNADGNYDDILYFEPIYQTGLYPTVPGATPIAQPPLAQNAWQPWNAAAGGWWSLNAGTGGPPLDTLAHYSVVNPGARLATNTPAFRITAGFTAPTWNNFDGYFDNVNVNGTCYDFEPFSGRKTLDFDGDNRADYAVISSGGTDMPQEFLSPKQSRQRIRAGIPRPISKEINIGGGPTWEILFSGGGAASIPFGQLGDFYVPGQFTLDNRTDIAVWRPSTQEFTIRSSETGNPIITTVAIGNAASDPTVTGDYTGDGIDDPCVFTGTQWIYLPNNGNGTFGAAVTVSFGQLGDFPSPGDYNGDGLNDFAVERQDPINPQNAHFYLDYNGITPGVSDADGVLGLDENVIVPSDYDGDGTTDFAIADETTYPYIYWVYASSATGILIGHAWGDNTIGFQTQGDYDGDGSVDIAVWHSDPSGIFFVRRSSDLLMGIQGWGLSTDYPVAYYQAH